MTIIHFVNDVGYPLTIEDAHVRRRVPGRAVAWQTFDHGTWVDCEPVVRPEASVAVVVALRGSRVKPFPTEPCRRGHEPNWRINVSGDRVCKTCDIENRRRYREQAT